MDEDKTLLEKVWARFATQQQGLDELLRVSTHDNGFKREEAVRALGMRSDPRAVPALLVRVNDWVPEVRAAALDALKRLQTPGNVRVFVAALPDLFHLQTCRRSDHHEFVADVTEYLLAQENVWCVKEAAFGDEPAVVGIALRLCIEHRLLKETDLAQRCLSSHNVVVRSMGVDLLRRFSDDELGGLLRKAIKDPYMPVRREAFQLYLRRFSAQGLVIAESMLFDRHGSVREIAIAALAKNGVDVRAIYSAVVASDSGSVSRKKCSILGLAYLGATNEVPAIRAHMVSAFPAVRKAVIQALGELVGSDARHYLLTLLGDSSPSVAKESSRIVAKLGLKLGADEVIDGVDMNRYPHTLPAVVNAVRASNKWERLLILLELANMAEHRNTSDVGLLRQEFIRWDARFNSSAEQPTERQIGDISRAYGSGSRLLDEQSRRAIEFTLRVMGATKV